MLLLALLHGWATATAAWSWFLWGTGIEFADRFPEAVMTDISFGLLLGSTALAAIVTLALLAVGLGRRADHVKAMGLATLALVASPILPPLLAFWFVKLVKVLAATIGDRLRTVAALLAGAGLGCWSAALGQLDEIRSMGPAARAARTDQLGTELQVLGWLGVLLLVGAVWATVLVRRRTPIPKAPALP